MIPVNADPAVYMYVKLLLVKCLTFNSLNFLG